MTDLQKTCEIEVQKTKLLELNWENPRTYAEWLGQTYHYVAHSTRIIGLAGSLFNQDQDELHHKFMEHVSEEKHHERIIPVDLKNIGYSLEQFSACESSRVLFQNQYYWIQNVNPISVYGYFLFLEGISVHFGPQIYARLKAAHPEKASRYLKVHVDVDGDHVDGHFKIINKLPEAEQKLIQENLVLTSFLYRSMLDQIESNSIINLLKKVS